MAGHGKTLGSGAAKKAQSRSSKAGLQLPVGRNRRKEQNMVKQTIGFNWGAAGVVNTHLRNWVSHFQ